MAEFSSANGASVFHEAMIRFISGILEKQLVPGGATSCKRGAFVVLAGPDGSGKTTVARRICCLAETQKQFRRVRYFHWRPRILRETVFPLPQYQEVRRKPKLDGNVLQSCFSAGRLLKNLVLTNIAHWLRIGPLLRRNTLVLADRYFYNYYLDPVSVKYYGPRWLLDRLRPFFPRPDLVVVLKAPAEVLHERKQELSRDEIRHQNRLLDQLPLDGVQRLEVDASQPAEESARRIVQRIIEMLA
jgi:thymidylate kinase